MKQVYQIKSLAALCGVALVSMMLHACSSDDQDATTAFNDSQWDGRILLSSNVNDITRATSEVPVTQGSNQVFPSGTDVDLFISENGANTHTYTGEVNYLQATTPTGSGTSGVGNFNFFSNAGRTASVTRYWPASGNGLYFYAYYPSNKITGTVTNTTITPQTFECGTSQGGAEIANGWLLDSNAFTVKAAGNTELTNYCIIPPQLLTGKTIKVTLANGGEKTYTIPAMTAQAGRKYTFTITVGLYSLSVTSTITDWTTGDSGSGTIYI